MLPTEIVCDISNLKESNLVAYLRTIAVNNQVRFVCMNDRLVAGNLWIKDGFLFYREQMLKKVSLDNIFDKPIICVIEHDRYSALRDGILDAYKYSLVKCKNIDYDLIAKYPPRVCVRCNITQPIKVLVNPQMNPLMLPIIINQDAYVDYSGRYLKEKLVNVKMIVNGGKSDVAFTMKLLKYCKPFYVWATDSTTELFDKGVAIVQSGLNMYINKTVPDCEKIAQYAQNNDDLNIEDLLSEFPHL